MDFHSRIRTALESTATPPAADVVDELAQHAEAIHDAAIAEGLDAAGALARVDALIATWKADASALRHRTRRPSAVPPPPIHSASPGAGLLQDSRYAFRLIRRQPRFAALVILTMALGIGMTTALFSVTYGVLLKPLPWPEGGRIVALKETRGGHPPRFGSVSNAAYLAWQEQPQTIDEIGAWTGRTATWKGDGEPERVRGANVTASLLRALGVVPLTGSLFAEANEVERVVIVSESFWRQRLNGDEHVIGRTLRLDDEAWTIIGVLPDAASYPDRQTRILFPFRVTPATGNALSMFESVARLRPGATVDQAATEGTARGRFAANTGMTTTAIFGSDGPIEFSGKLLTESLTADVRRPILVLLAAIGLLLLIASMNIASLQLARATARRRELAIRASIGASMGRILRQLVIENLALGLTGGALGVGLAWLLERSAPSILPPDFPRVAELSFSLPIILFAAAVSVLTSVAFGLAPLLRLRRLNLVGSLAEDGLAPVGSGRRGVARTRLTLVAAQIAIACVLLVGALLLARSFAGLLHADRGFEPAAVTSGRVALPASSYTPARRSETLGQIVDRLRTSAAVRSAAFSTELPLTPGGSTSAFTFASPEAPGGTVTIQASPKIVSPQFFETLGLQILAGRTLLDTDTVTSQPVLVVNDTFRRRYLGDRALGATVPMALWGQNQTGDATIVGIVEDVKYVGATVSSLPEIYFSYRQLKVGVRPTIAWLFVRSDDQQSAAAAVRSAVKAADANLIPESLMSLEDRLLAGSLARPRLYALLIASFAATALVVTGVGLFGVLSYSVSQRTRELGIRAALGATRLELVGLVVKQALVVSVVGTGVGLVASFWLTQSVGALLYGVTTRDLVTYVAVAAVLIVVAAAAGIQPARRAATLDPVKALRS